MSDLPLIHTDVETRSAVNLSKRGAPCYAEDESTSVLCVCWKSEDDKDVWSWVPGQDVPEVFQKPYVMAAHNAAFERVIFEHILHPKFGFKLPEYYVCTMAACGYHNLPLSLDAAAVALKLDVRKSKEGKILMLEMCRPKEKDPMPLFEDCGIEIDDSDDPRKMRELIEYCKQDVIVEVAIHDKIRLSEFEQKVYNVDQKINSRGIKIDVETVKAVDRTVKKSLAKDELELREITGGEVQSAAEIKGLRDWLAKKGVETPDLRADTVDSILSTPQRISKLPADCRRVLEIRQVAALTSLNKFPAMLECVSSDSRARGCFIYCGATSTGRWTSQRIQLHNLPRLGLNDDAVKVAVDLFRTSDIDAMRVLLGDPIHIAKQMIRPMLCSDVGLTVGDYSKIELCVGAWLSGQKDLIQEINDGVCTYSSMAAHIYGRTWQEVYAGYKNGEAVSKNQRQIGKCAVLGCGYGMGAEKFLVTLLGWGIEADERLAKRAIDAFRLKNDRFKWIWQELNSAALRAYDYGHRVNVGDHLAFACDQKNRHLMLRLPSGRILNYYNVSLEDGSYGREITCANTDPKSKNVHPRKKLYGGLFFENACQGTARDVMADALVRGDEKGMRFIGTTHDEIVMEHPDGANDLRELMETNPPWGKGIPLKAECFSCADSGHRYTK